MTTLRELVEKWKADASRDVLIPADPEQQCLHYGYIDGRRLCANELEAALPKWTPIGEAKLEPFQTYWVIKVSGWRGIALWDESVGEFASLALGRSVRFGLDQVTFVMPLHRPEPPKEGE